MKWRSHTSGWDGCARPSSEKEVHFASRRGLRAAADTSGLFRDTKLTDKDGGDGVPVPTAAKSVLTLGRICTIL